MNVPGAAATQAAAVLVIDDDPQVRLLLANALRPQGFRVDEAASGEAAMETLERLRPEVVLLDVMMPGLDGVETCRRIRERSSVPIVMLTALGRDQDIAAGLAAGADDYCTKPVSIPQLTARIRAQLRRRDINVATGPGGRAVGGLALDRAGRRAVVGGRAVDLSPREYALLDRLARTPGRPVRHEELIAHVWGRPDSAYRERLRSFVKLLRRKIEPEPENPRYLRSRARIGYVLDHAGSEPNTRPGEDPSTGAQQKDTPRTP